jgi:hypothetical protein
MRPRNFLKIFNHCRGFATNFRHVKIDEEDIEKGLRAYSNDLLVELDHELTDVILSLPRCRCGDERWRAEHVDQNARGSRRATYAGSLSSRSTMACSRVPLAWD